MIENIFSFAVSSESPTDAMTQHKVILLCWFEIIQRQQKEGVQQKK